MKMMGYTKAKTKSDELINIFNSCDSLYKDCSECPLNSLIIFTENDEYISICHFLCFFREDIKDKIDKALCGDNGEWFLPNTTLRDRREN